jgi:hypothetical protein
MDRLGADPKVLQRCVKTRSKDVFDNYPPSDLVQRAREVLRSEYDGTLALARLNCFAVLRLCQDILLGIAARFRALGTAAWPPEPPPEISKLGLFDIKEVNIQNAIYCIYLTMRCVDGGWDGGIDGSLRGQFSLKQIKDAMLDLPPVVVMRDVVAEVCEGKNVEHFLWKNV